MATHTYVVTSAFSVGDVATIIGTVDTIPSTGPIAVTITMWLTALIAAKNVNMAALEALVAPVMLGAAVQNGLTNPTPPVVVTQLPTGTFTL